MSSERETEVLRQQRAPRRAPAATLADGSEVGSWRVVRHIATGGCGAVYEVSHRVLDRSAAVKVLHADLAASPSMVARFVQEAKAANLIGHTHIVDIFDVGELADGRPFMAMELLAEENLEDRLIADGCWSLADTIALFAPLCDALGAAHARGVIHRDVKARNVGFARGSFEPAAAKLLDFGIAKLLEASSPGQSSPTQRVGTPQSMSPEQIRGERVDARTDVYGLGVLLFHVLTGRYPFESDDSLEVERMHLEVTPPRPSTFVPLPPAIDRLVERAMAKDPAARPGSVAELFDELRAAAGEPPAERVVPAVAIHVALHVDDAGDEALDVFAAQQEEVADRLRASGFVLALVTATATLGVAPLPPAPADASAAVGDALALAAALERALVERPDAVPGAIVTVAVTAASAVVRDGVHAVEPEVTGGEVLETTAWVPARGATTAVHVSPSARALAGRA